MSVFSRGRTLEESTTPLAEEAGTVETEDSTAIAGDRGIPSVNRARSVQSRLSSLLAVALMVTLGVGLLSWYYARALTRPRQVHEAAQVAARNRAQGEMALPAIGRITAPVIHVDHTETAPAADAAPGPGTLERLLGPAPPLPASTAVVVSPAGLAQPQAAPSTAKSPGELAFERRLAGPAFARNSKEEGAPTSAGVSGFPPDLGASAPHPLGPGGEGASADPLNSLMRATLTPAVAASLLPTRRFLLAKGAFIDCTLETAIDSTLPGMTTCITATDTFGEDGSVVLLERGTKLIGETRGEVEQGAARIFVLWTEARTPTGVAVPLSSPGTDELGRSGLPGEVNRHFWDRFGAAILLTVVSGAVQGAVNSQNSGGSVVVSPGASADVMTEVLRSTVNIRPTVTKAEGDRIQVFVARDVDFRSVYQLRIAQAGPKGTP